MFIFAKKPSFSSFIQYSEAYMGEQKSDFGLQGGNTVHQGILEYVLYYIRFDLQGGIPPSPPTPTYAQRDICKEQFSDPPAGELRIKNHAIGPSTYPKLVCVADHTKKRCFKSPTVIQDWLGMLWTINCYNNSHKYWHCLLKAKIYILK